MTQKPLFNIFNVTLENMSHFVLTELFKFKFSLAVKIAVDIVSVNLLIVWKFKMRVCMKSVRNICLNWQDMDNVVKSAWKLNSCSSKNPAKVCELKMAIHPWPYTRLFFPPRDTRVKTEKYFQFGFYLSCYNFNFPSTVQIVVDNHLKIQCGIILGKLSANSVKLLKSDPFISQHEV